MNKYLLISAVNILMLLVASSVQSQEVRLYGSTQIYGGISNGFNGVGIGFENPLSGISTFSIDVNMGFHLVGSALEFKPALLFYLNKNYKGFL